MRFPPIADLALYRTRRASIDEHRMFKGRAVRFSSRLDDESERFEEELSERLDGALPLPQRHAWLRHEPREIRLLQMRDEAGCAAMQVALLVERSRYAPWAASARAFKMGSAVTSADEAIGIEALRDACEAEGDIATLRLQPRRTDARALLDLEERARRSGFELADPESVTRTLVVELDGDDEAMLEAMPRRTRRNIRQCQRAELDVRVLLDDTHVDACNAASKAAMARTGAHDGRIPWGATMALAKSHPDLVRVLGLFDRARPGELLAFVVGHRHGAVAEYASAGSLEDPALRKLPFNCLLIWELLLWAKSHGARLFDLGGVTSGADDDPLAGISAFKRHFSRHEIEVGREMVATLNPVSRLAAGALRSVASATKRAAGLRV